MRSRCRSSIPKPIPFMEKNKHRIRKKKKIYELIKRNKMIFKNPFRKKKEYTMEGKEKEFKGSTIRMKREKEKQRKNERKEKK